MPILNFQGAGKMSVPLASSNEVMNFLSGGEDTEYVSAQTALKNSDIYSAIFQLSGDLASAQLVAEKKMAQTIINNPSSTTNAHAFWQALFAQLLLGGEAYAYRWRNINGTDLYWEYLRPSQVSPFLLDDGSGLVYNITFDEPGRKMLQSVPQGDVIHIRLLSKNGGMTGISPLSALANELDIKQKSNALTKTALSQAIISPGVLKIQKGGLLSWKDKANRSIEFMNQAKNSNNGPVVIDDLEEYTPLEIKSDIAKLLSQADWTGNQIAKAYGIPNSYLNGQGDQQSSLDQIKGMYANALSRYMNSITSELSNKLNTYVRANIRPAIDPMQDYYATSLGNLVKSGVLASNQVNYMLKESGYLPEDLPEPINLKAPVKDKDDNLKGGE